MQKLIRSLCQCPTCETNKITFLWVKEARQKRRQDREPGDVSCLLDQTFLTVSRAGEPASHAVNQSSVAIQKAIKFLKGS